MDISKVQYFEKVETNKQKDFLQAQNNCILCGNSLELQHVRVELKSEIKEEAHCALPPSTIGLGRTCAAYSR